MIVAEAQLTRRYFGTSPVHTIPSFTYSRLVQLKHIQLCPHARRHPSHEYK
ncbi:unnamed protein product [Hymenolepis diminuta]|uniref:Uncharacterized protein n=1 Tax=Hymenolepis diminuta TaxID=6216 RepID=A0A564ZAV2_HYMDI|nr:unnamed protein product [Hymenolepis diminuta]